MTREQLVAHLTLHGWKSYKQQGGGGGGTIYYRVAHDERRECYFADHGRPPKLSQFWAYRTLWHECDWSEQPEAVMAYIAKEVKYAVNVP